MPSLADNNPDKWQYDLHTRIKHEILMSYLDPWTTILGQSASSLAYVDGFAGKGRYTKGEPGSPLLVIDTVVRAMDERSIRASHVSFHLIEQNRDNFENLKRELAEHQPAHDPRIKLKLYHTSFAGASAEVIADIRRNAQPSFFFIDPFGYDDSSMDMIGQVLTLPRAEVMINLMYDFATRAVGMGNIALMHTLDLLFGTGAWRELIGLSGEEREREFLNLYRLQLKLRGAAYVLPFRMGDDARDRTLYYLLHATKHIKGAQVMKDAMVASGTPGHLAYRGTRQHQLIPLFDIDAAHLPDLLLARFQGRSLSFDDIVAQTFEETGTCRKPQYRDCLRELERTEQVTVRRVSSMSARGLGGRDVISFSGGHPMQGRLFDS